MRLSSAAVLFLSASVFFACADEATGPRPSDVAHWSLSKPTLTLGSLHGEADAFSPIRRVALGPNGRIYVLLSQEYRVAIFSSDGSPLGSIGRQGEGPGEFSFPWDLDLRGDTVWVLEPRDRRISFFLGSEIVRSRAYEFPRDIHPERGPRAVAPLPGDGVLGVTDSQGGWSSDVTSTPSLILIDRDGVLDTLATYSTDFTAGQAIRHTVGAIPDIMVFPQPFPPGDHWAVSHDGAQVALVKVDEHLPGEDPFGYTATVLELTGDTVFSTWVPIDPVPLTEEHVQEEIRRIARDRFPLERVREALYLPKNHPPVSRVVFARGGAVWVGREERRGAALIWNVISADGLHLADVETPPGFDLQAITEGFVLGLVHDEFDVPYVEKREVVRAP